MKGIVKEITNDSIFVEIENLTSQECDSCSKCDSDCNICAKKTQETTILEGKLASDEVSVSIGEEVLIEISPNKKIASSTILFLIPILSLLGSFKLSTLFTQNEFYNGLFAILGFVICVFVIIFVFRNKNVKDSFKPTITKIHFDN